MTKPSLVVSLALGVIILAAGLAIFVVAIGLPGSSETVTRSCSLGSPCTETEQFKTFYVPELLALIPLAIVSIIGFGLVTKRLILSWSGVILLLAFSFVLIFSVGFFFVPIATVLVGLLAVIQSRKDTILKSAAPR